MGQSRVLFITGTGTGVGKTVVTGTLLHGFRRQKIHALAMKPFCTGSRIDVRHLARIQNGELTLDEINPFHYAKPLAPLVAAGSRSPALDAVLDCVAAIGKSCDLLLVEGAGGLLAPLGKLPRGRASTALAVPGAAHAYSAADLIDRLKSEVIVVAPNKLGTLNHTLLTINALSGIRHREVIVVLVDQRRPDLSARTNRAVLRRLLAPIPVVSMPHLGAHPLSRATLDSQRSKINRLVVDLRRPA